MSDFELRAVSRTDTGKGAMRRLRGSGMVPGVLYGGGKDATLLQVEANYLRKQLENDAIFSHILSIDIDGRKSQAVIKALQRSPRSHEVTHIDLLKVSSETELTMHVPLRFLNEEASIGKKAGGVVSHLMMDVEVVCLPADLPEFIEVDLEEVDIGQTVHLSGLKLPAGVRLSSDVSEADADHPMVAIQKPAQLDVEEAEEVVEEEDTSEE